MMKACLIGIARSAAAMLAQADCADDALGAAPALPSLESSSYLRVMALHEPVRNYLEAAELRLKACGERSNVLAYNRAVAKLEAYAEDYNRLAQFYNRAFIADSQR